VANPAPELLLGIDVGTTWSKAAVVTLDGIERGHGRRRTDWTEVRTGAEIDPDRLAAGALDAARAALEAVPGGRVLGIGVTSMAETGVLLDRRGKRVTCSIAWHDERGGTQARALEQRFGASFVERTGRSPTRLCSAAKLRWLMDNVRAAGHGARWLSVAEWVAHRLGAHQVAEPSLACRTGFLDLRARKPWTEVVEWTGAPPPLLADVRPAGTPAGRARPDRRTGSRARPDRRTEGRAWIGIASLDGAVVTVAGLDHSVAAVGAGATHAGDVFDSCGTAEAFIKAVEPLPAEARLAHVVARGVNVDWHVIPERMALISGIHSGLAMLRMLARLGVDEADRASLDRAALAIPTGANPVRVLDVLGTRPEILGASSASPAHVWRATLDAIAEVGSGVLERIRSLSGPERRVVVAGGGARSAGVRAIKRAVLGPFVEPRVTEAGARGAALFGGLAAGVYPDVSSFPEPEMTSEEP
jgi:sugar (pentulose or hexulose) kinase